MGYTHYWRREKEISRKAMRAIVDDFKKVLPELSKVIDLAGGDGKGKLTTTYELVSFNGRTKCNHPQKELFITWPSKNAGGIANPDEEVKDGYWFGGAQLSKRACDGDCSHETCYFPRVIEVQEWQESQGGLYFECCKTAYKPYDLAVISFLIIAKHHLNGKLVISSDGTDGHWLDGKQLCQSVLGYGEDFKL